MHTRAPAAAVDDVDYDDDDDDDEFGGMLHVVAIGAAVSCAQRARIIH